MVDKEFLINGLLQHNYLPVQKEKKEEIPPIFNTLSLSKNIAVVIARLPLSILRKKLGGFDSIIYKSTRFNNVPRVLSVPHPQAYCSVVKIIYDNWDKFGNKISSNKNSIVKPMTHLDGRIIIMNYDTSYNKRQRYYDLSFGKKFIVHTDISNFYPSLYSHALPWSLVGFDIAKSKKDKKSEWFNQIDAGFRHCSRNETSGVPIGPAISNIASEIILQTIDANLSKEYNFIRFVDDYTAYCNNYEEAESFIRELSVELGRYKLNINIKKTEINLLPMPISEDWIAKIRTEIPQGKTIKEMEVHNVLDSAVRLQNTNKDGSILKYAANSIVTRLDKHSSLEFIKYVLKLSYYYPVLIPTLYSPIKKFGTSDISNKIMFLLEDSITNQRSDSACWLMYYCLLLNYTISSELADKIIAWEDCFSLLLLSRMISHKPKVINFINNLNVSDLYRMDNYWLLIYQLYYENDISSSFSYIDTCFEILKTNSVSFLNL